MVHRRCVPFRACPLLQVPIQQSNQAALALVISVLRGYCTFQAVTGPSTVHGPAWAWALLQLPGFMPSPLCQPASRLHAPMRLQQSLDGAACIAPLDSLQSAGKSLPKPSQCRHSLFLSNTPAQVLGAFTAPSLAVTLVPSNCPIYEDQSTGEATHGCSDHPAAVPQLQWMA